MDSIAAQDLEGVEVVVVDDGSTDGSVAIARSYEDRIEHLRVIQNEHRLGAVANVNRCVELSRGRWIKPVFQDDLLEPGCLTTMRAARQARVPVVVCARRYLYEDGVPEFRREACEHLVEHSMCRRFGSGHVSADSVAEVVVEQAGGWYPQVNLVGEPVAVMFSRRAALRSGGFDSGYVQLWDYELVLRLAMARGVVLVDEPLATFRVHEESETARNFVQASYRINVLDRLRLSVAYATDPRYRPIRLGAMQREPITNMTALAVGIADAAKVLRNGLPADARPEASRLLDEVAEPLPERLPPSSWVASLAAEVEEALIAELMNGPWLGLSEIELRAPAAPAPAEESDRPPDPMPEELDPEPSDDHPLMPVDPRAARSGLLGKMARAARALRTSQWWGHMLGPITAFAALQMGWRDVPPAEGMVRLVALLVSAVALASYGYVVNDAADVEADWRVGKANAMARFSRPVKVALIVGFAGMGALPWAFIELSDWALVTLATIYLIPILYSVRPLRLKERDVLGPIADASNAFAVPALFTMALFAPLGPSAGPEPLMVVGGLLWTYGFGLRAILLHQVQDAVNDQASGTSTLVTRIGADRAVAVQRSVLFPSEVGGLVLLLGTLATWSRPTAAIVIGGVAAFHTARLTNVVHRGLFVGRVEQGWFMLWYHFWPALIVACALTVRSPWYSLFVVLVVSLFWPRARSAAGNVRLVAGELRRRLPRRSSGPA